MESIFQMCVGCAYAYVVAWVRLADHMRLITLLGVGSRVGIKKPNPVGGSGDSTDCRQLSHLLAICWGLHHSNGILPELGTRTSSLAALRWEEGCCRMCPGVYSVKVGKFSWEASQSPFLPPVVGCICDCIVFCCCRGSLAMKKIFFTFYLVYFQ